MALTELDFVDYDYQSLVAQFQNKLKATDAWKDTYQSSTGTFLTQLVAATGNMILFYLERRATESYLSLASNKSSVINLVKLLNYRPKRPIGAAGTLTFSVASAPTYTVLIPQYTEVQTADGYVFTTIYEASILSNSTEITSTAIQGVLTSLLNTSDGNSNQEFTINDTWIENNTHTEYRPFNTLRVFVDSIEWDYVSSFLNSNTSDSHYTIKHNLDDTISIVFGDDVNGSIPTVDAVIEITYFKTDGIKGNVYSTGKVTTLNSTIYDTTGAIIATTVTNSSTMTGGDDAETMEEIVAEAPNVFATGDRLVTKADFRAFILNYSSVADVNAWGENEENPPNYDMFNTVKLAILLQNWELPTAGFKTTLSTALREKSMLTVKYEFVEPTIIYVIHTLSVVVVTGYAPSQIQSQIETYLENQYELGVTTLLGTSRRLSNYIRAIDEFDGVKYLTLELSMHQDLTANYSSFYDWGTTFECLSVLESSVSIYATVGGVADVLVAADDGAGNIVTQNSLATVTGVVNYTTGVLNFDVSGITPTNVYAVYKQDEDGDIVIGANNICNISSTVFTSIGYD